MDQIAVIADMVRDAERHADAMAADRVRAVEYYRGEMRDVPSEAGRSAMVRRTVRSHVRKVLPSLVRTLLNADEIVEFAPIGAGDEESADQASDYLNFVVVPEADVRSAVYDALHDALLLRNGILKWWWDDRQAVRISRHTGLPDDAFAELVADDDVEVLEHSETVENIEGQPVTLHDAKIRRVFRERRIRCAAVPRERFLIHPDAVTLDDSLLVGEKCEVRRSDLIAMGYDAELVDSLAVAQADEYEESVRRAFVSGADEAQRANDPIDYYDMYIRVDVDGDGIAELRHMCFAGGLAERNLLVDEECDAVQFADVCILRQPHQWEGVSLFDDLEDLQRALTVLLRQSLDNIYWQNNPQPVFQAGVVTNEDAIFNPEFGKPIRIREGIPAREAYSVQRVPFVAQQSFAMMEMLEGEATDRTGVSDASAGLAPDALQNMTAKASAMIEQAGIGQTELMVRTAAEGLKQFFRGLLQLVIRHQDVPRTVRLRDKWVTFDPRQWNAEMDCTVNTGLGAGTRERDMMMMQNVLAMQEKMLAGFGPDNPFVKPENIYAAVSKLVESAGLRTPALYFTEPQPDEVEALLKQRREAPSPEMMKLQGQMQVEQAKMAANRDKERAQLEADLVMKRADIEADRVKQERELAWERDKFLMSQRLELTKIGLAQNEAGEPINPDAEAMRAMLRQSQAMLAGLSDQMARSSRPKRIVRDGMGEIVGVAGDDMAMRVVRDASGEVVGLEPMEGMMQ